MVSLSYAEDQPCTARDSSSVKLHKQERRGGGTHLESSPPLPSSLASASSATLLPPFFLSLHDIRGKQKKMTGTGQPGQGQMSA